MTNADKMTNKKALNYILNTYGEDIPVDVKEKLEGMVVALEKKSGAERKPSARQVENEGIKAKILENMKPNTLYSINEMLKNFDCFDETFTSQRVSALLAQLVEAKAVVRVVDKRKTYFSLA